MKTEREYNKALRQCDKKIERLRRALKVIHAWNSAKPYYDNDRHDTCALCMQALKETE